MPRSLTPETLTMQSFAFSQGVRGLQYDFLMYMQDHHDIRPSFDTNIETFMSYYDLLGGTTATGARSHVRVVPDHEPYHFGEVLQEEFKQVRLGYTAYREAHDSPTVEDITAHLTKVETSAFRRIRERWSAGDDVETDFRNRMASRRALGRLSFLRYYGVEGNGTGHAEVDGLYRGIGKVFMADAFRSDRQEHEDEYQEAETLLDKLT